ncbi:MAG: type VI secretion system Vgr family protein [Gammaproteobacteria bacterium]
MASPAARFDMVPFELSISGLDDSDVRVVSFSGQETVSRTYEYTVDLVCRDDGVMLEDIIGKPASLVINSADGEYERSVHGVVSSFHQAESGTRVTLYRAQIVPALQFLSYRNDCRIFQDMSVPEIIEKVFDSAGLQDYSLNLSASYDPRVYCVQYRESDLNFVMRLMEDEGIFYFFEHTEDKSILTLIDVPGSHLRLPGADLLEHHDTGGGLAENEFVFGVGWQESITTNAVTLRDFDFKKPSLDHMHLDKDVDQCMRLEHYDYPGTYEAPALGNNRVCTRLDALQANRRRISGSATVRRLAAGYRFTLSHHPNDRFNQEFIVTDVRHHGRSPQALEQDQGGGAPAYTCQFSAVPADVALRPGEVARRPRMDGIQTAIVVGPAGEEIYTDEFARVKVQFHWDREGSYNEKSSCWVRVSQLWAGAGWGGMDIPRIGHEVVVSFEEGDPDRPLITGRVYHGENRPPHGLPVNKVKSTIRSNSTPGGGGFNELTFDDTKGNEEVFIHSQHNTTIKTLNDKNQSTGHNETLSIGNNRSKTVGVDEKSDIGSNRTETVGANEKISIGVNRTEDVGSNEQISIGVNRSETVGANEDITIGANRSEKVGANETITIGMNKAETVAIAKALTIGAAYQVSVGAASNRTIGLSASEQVGLNKDLRVGKKLQVSVGDEIVFKTGESSITMKKNGSIVIAGKDITIRGSGEINVKANKNVVIKGKKILEN